MRTALSDKDLAAVEKRPEAAKLAEGETPPTTPTQPTAQDLIEQIVKYVPAETVAFYVPALGGFATVRTLVYGADAPGTLYFIALWLVFLLGLGGTYYYLHKKAKADLTQRRIANANKRAIAKAAISTVAFAIWAIGLGGPWDFIPFYEAIGAVLIPTFTFGSTILYDIIPFPPSGNPSS